MKRLNLSLAAVVMGLALAGQGGMGGMAEAGGKRGGGSGSRGGATGPTRRVPRKPVKPAPPVKKPLPIKVKKVVPRPTVYAKNARHFSRHFWSLKFHCFYHYCSRTRCWYYWSSEFDCFCPTNCLTFVPPDGDDDPLLDDEAEEELVKDSRQQPEKVSRKPSEKVSKKVIEADPDEEIEPPNEPFESSWPRSGIN